MRHLAAFAVGFGLLILSVSGASAAGTVYCSAENPLPAGTYGSVDAGAGCVLDERHVIEGSLVLTPDADGIDLVGTHVTGDVASFGAISVEGVHIGGSIYLLGGTGTSVTDSWVGGDIWNQCGCISSEVVNNEVVGSVLLDGTGQESVLVIDNEIGGDLTVQGFAGGFTVDRNQVGGHFRLADTLAWQPFVSTVNANHVSGRFEISRNSVSQAFGEDAGAAIVVSENVVEGHAGVFQNSELAFLDNQIAGALVCSNNDEFVHSGNSARTRFGECTD